MRQPKTYKATILPVTELGSDGCDPDVPETPPVLVITIDPTATRKFNFNSWLGNGIDSWVWACLNLLRTLSHSGTVTPRTMVNYAGVAIPNWFAFLVQSKATLHPSGLLPGHIESYIVWLLEKHPVSTSARTIYSGTKAILRKLHEGGEIAGTEDDLFPARPFRLELQAKKHTKALSSAEVAQLAAAIRKDLIAIHKDCFEGSDSEALAVSFLLIVLRTGVNPTPLLEAGRDCLSPNPLMPNMMVMTTFKRRGNGTQRHPLKIGMNSDETAVIPMDGVAVLKGVITRTARLVSQAPENIADRLWLYRSASQRCLGKINALNEASLHKCIERFAQRHSLMGDDGNPFVPAIKRLRKTVEARLWKLSDGDLVAVAAAMNHSPQVADQHYLDLTDEMKSEAARFVGMAFPEILRGNTSVDFPHDPTVQDNVINTPVGRCANVIHNGTTATSPCDRFTECITCPTFVVVGSVKDLHRLFSFQRFLKSEVEYMDGPELSDWRTYRRKIIDLIDQFTAAKFPRSVVAEAKSLACTAPHPFWANRVSAVTVPKAVGWL